MTVYLVRQRSAAGREIEVAVNYPVPVSDDFDQYPVRLLRSLPIQEYGLFFRRGGTGIQYTLTAYRIK